jgi:hypothetical protein
MSATKSGDPRIQYISDSIRAIPDFPLKGKAPLRIATLRLTARVSRERRIVMVSYLCSVKSCDVICHV